MFFELNTRSVELLQVREGHSLFQLTVKFKGKVIARTESPISEARDAWSKLVDGILQQEFGREAKSE